MPKISILIPIYNVEPYIERCVRSLMEQTFEDIEYVFVDDASPDNSVVILEKVIADYPSRESEVRVLHHPQNRGLAAARNTGLDVATGEYICWCDSDDWMEPDYCSSLYAKAQQDKADVVVCDFYHHYKDATIVERIQEFETFQQLIDNRRAYCWNLFCRFVRHSLLTDNRLRSYDGINMWEDLGLALRFHYYSSRTVHLHRPLYHYNRVNPDSIINLYENPVSGKQSEYIIQSNECIRLLTEFLTEKHLSVKIFRQKAGNVIVDALLVTGEIDRFNASFCDLIPFYMHRTELSLSYRLVVSCAMLGIRLPLRLYRYISSIRHS